MRLGIQENGLLRSKLHRHLAPTILNACQKALVQFFLVRECHLSLQFAADCKRQPILRIMKSKLRICDIVVQQ